MNIFRRFFIIILSIPLFFLIYDFFYTYYISKKNDDDNEKTPNQKGFTYNNSKIKCFIDGQKGFNEIERLIKSAKVTLFIEIFIFHYDSTGIRIANLLAKKKSEGVDVKVLIDSTGLKFGKNDNQIINLLKSNNVDVKIFNNNYFSRTGLNITHRKIIVADSDSCIIGGMNFGEKYEHEWHDAVFLLKGHISNELQKHFLYDWEKAGGKYPKKLVKLRKRTKYGNKLMKVIRTNVIPDNVEHEFYKEMQKAIRNTKKEIYMTSPYFSDDQIIKDLICAKKRGVKITIVLPENNNHLIFKNLNLYTAKVFFDSGIDVYFYKPNFSHLKVYVFDDKTIIGSANIDQRSFTGNQEIGVLVDDNEFSKKIKNDIFIKDINFSEKATEQMLELDPLKKVFVKTLEVLDYYL